MNNLIKILLLWLLINLTFAIENNSTPDASSHRHYNKHNTLQKNSKKTKVNAVKKQHTTPRTNSKNSIGQKHVQAHKHRLHEYSSHKKIKTTVTPQMGSAVNSDLVANNLNNQKTQKIVTGRPVFYEKIPHLYSYAALIMDADNGKIIATKNPDSPLPIASITKLMTAMIVLDSGIDLDQYVEITPDDIDTIKNTFSRLKVGMKFRRRDLLLLALMSSENRAAHALGRTTFAGGLNQFLQAMNQKAITIGMKNTHFYDPTGLTNANRATAEDLGKMVQAAFTYSLIRQDTTTKDADVILKSNYMHRYINSDALVRGGQFQIELSKTGFINEAGHCLVLYSIINTRPIIMVFLNSTGKSGRVIDALTMRNFIEHN